MAPYKQLPKELEDKIIHFKIDLDRAQFWKRRFSATVQQVYQFFNFHRRNGDRHTLSAHEVIERVQTRMRYLRRLYRPNKDKLAISRFRGEGVGWYIPDTFRREALRRRVHRDLIFVLARRFEKRILEDQ